MAFRRPSRRDGHRRGASPYGLGSATTAGNVRDRIEINRLNRNHRAGGIRHGGLSRLRQYR